VPKHVFEGQDWTSFKHFDTAKGWPVTTGPWQVVESSLQQKVFERRPSWWAAEQKFVTMPQVERNILPPMVSQMLRRHGVAASLALPPDFNDRFQKGQYVGSIYGHGGSIREPYDTLRLYQSQSIAVPGAHAVNFSRWKNSEFDKIVDEVYITGGLQ
jgi:ABC-type oligopeptide transport system substrate-binding subunit